MSEQRTAQSNIGGSARVNAHSGKEQTLQEAWAEFSGAEEPFDPETPHIQVFMPWFFHRWSPDPYGTEVADTAVHERSPTTLFLERRGARLDPVIRRYLESCLEAPFSFHEILRCDPGQGFHARDLFTGEERAVLERMATQGMQPGDIVFGQLVTAEGITILEAASLFFIPPIYKIELIDFRKELLRGEPRFTGAALCDWDIELIERYLSIMENVLHPPVPKLHNTDGEPLEMHRLVFDIDSPEKVLDALKSLDLGRSGEEIIAARAADDGCALRALGNREDSSAQWANAARGSPRSRRPRESHGARRRGRARRMKPPADPATLRRVRERLGLTDD